MSALLGLKLPIDDYSNHSFTRHPAFVWTTLYFLSLSDSDWRPLCPSGCHWSWMTLFVRIWNGQTHFEVTRFRRPRPWVWWDRARDIWGGGVHLHHSGVNVYHFATLYSVKPTGPDYIMFPRFLLAHYILAFKHVKDKTWHQSARFQNS